MNDKQKSKVAEQLVNDVMQGKFDGLQNSMLDEETLIEFASLVKRKKAKSDERSSFINDIIRYTIKFTIKFSDNKALDWNLGSILQHFSVGEVLEVLKNLTDSEIESLHGMIGINWVLGEYNSKDIFIIEFLNETVKSSNNSEAWWRAAFSLEKLTGENAINLLKRNIKSKTHSNKTDLKSCLENLHDKKNVIRILLAANSKDTKEIIFPKLRDKLIALKESPHIGSAEELINIVWLLGRLCLLTHRHVILFEGLIQDYENYEIEYYILWALQENPLPAFLKFFVRYTENSDPLLRKMAVRGIGEAGSEDTVESLESLLFRETEEKVITEISSSIYKLKSKTPKTSLYSRRILTANENGLIGDASDKWYSSPHLYEIFSEAQDPEGVCFDLIMRYIREHEIKLENPIDLATGTGRLFKLIFKHVDYEGTLYGVDNNEDMIEYLKRSRDRLHMYIKDVDLIKDTIKDFRLPQQKKSSFIISSYGFPSNLSNSIQCSAELKNVCDNLKENGIFITIGWDESWNDELSEMWYKYIPDNIIATDFDNWRTQRSSKVKSPRNCRLKWWKTGINIPLRFNNIDDAILVVGYLFGRDAIREVIQKQKKEWNMSMGITITTKDELKKIVESNNEGN